MSLKHWEGAEAGITHMTSLSALCSEYIYYTARSPSRSMLRALKTSVPAFLSLWHFLVFLPTHWGRGSRITHHQIELTKGIQGHLRRIAKEFWKMRTNSERKVEGRGARKWTVCVGCVCVCDNYLYRVSVFMGWVSPQFCRILEEV